MTSPEQGIDSGFLPVAAGATEFPSWSFSISNATAPLWFYCKQKSPAKYEPISHKSQVPALMPHFFSSHCQAGMVFAINPTADRSFDAFQVCLGICRTSPLGLRLYYSSRRPPRLAAALLQAQVAMAQAQALQQPQEGRQHLPQPQETVPSRWAAVP
jgi:hypothetical protein